MRTVLDKILRFTSIPAALLLLWAGYLFRQYNLPIIQSPLILTILGAAILCALLVLAIVDFLRTPDPRFPAARTLLRRGFLFLFFLFTAIILVISFLQSALLDYFQPFALYDDVIYLTLAGFVLLAFRFLVDSIGCLFRRFPGQFAILLAAASLLIPLSVGLWGRFQPDLAFQNIVGEPVDLFTGGEGGYASYRIPSLIVIPRGSTLANGDILSSDLVIAAAEGRRSGSLDSGAIDLVIRRSLDGGTVWNPPIVARQYQDGKGKTGNPTSVYDAETGTLFLFHITSGENPRTWVMASGDGGETFTEPILLGEGVAGPGHGIQISAGSEKGRLVVPAHAGKSSFAWISDDHGKTWDKSALVGSGDESEIAETGLEGELLMAVRTNHPVSQPHGDLYQLFSISADAGATWQPPSENTDLATPIVMVSLLKAPDGSLLVSYPDDFHSRANMTIAVSRDGGKTFSRKLQIYPGPSGYSELAALSNGEILLLFENGSVEYDQRISLVRVPREP